MIRKVYSKNPANCIKRTYGCKSCNYRKQFVLYDKVTEELAYIFDNLKGASKFLGMTAGSISSQVCRGKMLRRKYIGEWIIIDVKEERKYEAKVRKISAKNKGGEGYV